MPVPGDAQAGHFMNSSSLLSAEAARCRITGITLLEGRACPRDPDRHLARGLIGGVGEKRINHAKLARPERGAITPQICQESIGLLDERHHQPLLDLAAQTGVHRTVTHVNQRLQVRVRSP